MGMNESHKRMAELSKVTGVALDAALLKVRSAAQASAEITSRIAALDADRRRMVQDVESAATRAGADLLWHRWAEAQRAELNKALARARVAEDGARRAATRAFGRDEALAKVIEKTRRR